MGRWSHLDTDEERLPEGMTRIGYDADTQIYTYRDTDGSVWEGAPGCKYGKLQRVQDTAPPLPSVHIDDDIAGHEKPYVLHDYDDSESDDDETISDDIADEKKQHRALFSEKEILLPTAPVRAKLAPISTSITSPNPQQVPRRKPLPKLPSDDNDDDDTNWDKLSGTTARVSVSERSVSPLSSVNSYNETRQPPQPTSLKRAGTLSRLARFLSTSTSTSTPLSPTASPSTGAGAPPVTPHVSRRATVAAGQPPRRQTPAELMASAPRSGGAGASAPRRRATTFDEILGSADGRLDVRRG